MPRIEQSVEIDAPIARVYQIAKDVEAFPQFMADLQSLTVRERSPDGSRTVTDWVGTIREFKMKVAWTQEKTRNPVVRLHFALLSRNPFEGSRAGGTHRDHAMPMLFRAIYPCRRSGRQDVALPFHPVVFDSLFPHRLKRTWPYMQGQ